MAKSDTVNKKTKKNSCEEFEIVQPSAGFE